MTKVVRCLSGTLLDQCHRKKKSATYHEASEWGDEDEWHADKEEEYCSYCGEPGHMWEDCPDRGSASDAESTDSSVPLRDWDEELN